jgi:hypothetical protein
VAEYDIAVQLIFDELIDIKHAVSLSCTEGKRLTVERGGCSGDLRWGGNYEVKLARWKGFYASLADKPARGFISFIQRPR